ncbi:glycoside hydrolase family 3 N-terminal domain-containing protein [Halothermothrix orenii]|uniref:beta-glucosidase n=1 Tax=Halothermothrix orenii (strain H 168 / OCM 544 / DSM 9562) TaxID=373903 RepID=B8CZK9_HALOH|nr:glycoside hydrolase family 3 N-terminal domain-containing protein [Halothermothrix orenii]ACL70728.1 beta-glucosidase [Halothermothrix orenii H 168]
MVVMRRYTPFSVAIIILLLFIMGSGSVYSESIDRKVNDMLSQMSLEEKIGQMFVVEVSTVMERRGPFGTSGRIDTRKLKGLTNVGSIFSGGSLRANPVPNNPATWTEMINNIKQVFNDNSRIPVIYALDAIHGNNKVIGAPISPHNLGLASTWNPELVERVYGYTSDSLEAIGVSWNYAPVLDVARDPRWGRTYETFGEDPFLVSVMGAASVRGIQKSGRVCATAKHYIGYSGSENGMDRDPSYIPKRELYEVYYPPFKKAVAEGVKTIMVNSGEVNGIPVHVSKWLLNDLLRMELGFSGVIISDYADISKLHDYHMVAKDYEEAIIRAVNAGVDMFMEPDNYPGFYRFLIEAVKEGTVSEERINQSVSRILKLKMELGLFNEELKDPANAEKIISNNSEAVELFRQAARESIVLLQNKDNVLPLSREIKSVLVVGNCAESMGNLCGGWTINWQGPEETDLTTGKTILEAIKEKVAPGTRVDYIKYRLESIDIYVKKVLEAASDAEAIIVAIGEEPYAEMMGDVQNIQLPADQIKLIKALGNTGKPVITVLITGRPLAVGPILNSTPGLLLSFLPGTEGGNAVADVLFGDYNPSGKLPITIPKYTGQLPLYYNHKPGVDYDPQFPFGYGLSYTSFEYSGLTVKKQHDSLQISVDVKNIGDVGGTEVVQVYINDVYSSVTTPVRELKDFKKVYLRPGETRRVEFVIPFTKLTLYNENFVEVVEPGTFEIQIAGFSRRVKI